MKFALHFLWLGAACWAADFHIVGPGGGGAMFHPTISPHDPKTFLVACDMTGSYLTHDAGASWHIFNLGAPARFFAFDPHHAGVIYAGAKGLLRSTDGGQTWSLLWPKQSAIQGVEINSDHADPTLVAPDDPLGRIEAFAIDPDDPHTLLAGTRTGVYQSIDSANSWTRVASLSEVPLRVWLSGHVAHAVTARAVLVNQTLHPLPVSATLLDASPAGQVLYAVSETRIWISKDAGITWNNVALPGSDARLRAVAASAHHPETAYVSYQQLKLDGQSWSGVARTRDFGSTWKLVWKENHTMASNVHDAWIAPALGPGWGENPLALGVADQDPQLCIGTDFGRAMITADGGESWNAAYSRRVPGAAWTTTGLDVTTSYGYHIDPFDPKRRFITYTDIGLSRSEDGGKSWTRSVEGAPRDWTNTTYWVEFDPAVKGRMWAAMSETHDLPRPKMWRRTSVLKYRGGICVSKDGGKTWRPSSSGMPETAPTHILLDPRSPPAARVLYVAAFGRGVYKSSDGGRNWVLKNSGIAAPEPLVWRLARDSAGTLYVLLARRSDHGEIHDPGDGALYRSTDGAESWTRVDLPKDTNGPSGLAIDPRDPRRLYLATWARAAGLHGQGGGIWLSTDRGGTWRNVLDRDQHVYDVTLDPRDPKILYACGFESSAWRSSDRGEHWTRIPGYDFKWGHRVITDPQDPAQVFITTFGGSVWHGPGAP